MACFGWSMRWMQYVIDAGLGLDNIEKRDQAAGRRIRIGKLAPEETGGFFFFDLAVFREEKRLPSAGGHQTGRGSIVIGNDVGHGSQ